MPGLTLQYRPLSRPGHSFDWAIRAVLWLAYRILLAWWFVGRPQHHGAMIAIWLGGQILMIRHSYRSRLSWPGGGIGRGEEPADAAIRELHEELGFAVDHSALVFVEKTLERGEYRYDHIWIFELKLNTPPVLEPDGREVIGAAFLKPAEVLALPLAPYVRAYLQRRVD
jgi:8-oxo-dGTP diphosphatase